MKIKIVARKSYKLPDSLTEFQLNMYIHLINWKWEYITERPRIFIHKKVSIEYDAIIPEEFKDQYLHIYKPIIPVLKKLKYKSHKFFNHIVSSQAANINLFLPILLHPNSNNILRNIKSDFNQLATSQLYNGFQLEYWDNLTEDGLLGDHSSRSGTDSDIAIAYYNNNDELCLWLIEHKLTEKEFTECGGYKSSNNQNKDNCSKTYSDIIGQKSLCYYHSTRKFKYWNLTDTYQSFFPNHSHFSECPFKKGLNQLWRNQLLGLSIEADPRLPFQKVYFSVVRHPNNYQLDKSIHEYMFLVDNNPRFSAMTSSDVIQAASNYSDSELQKWIKWYKVLYNI